MRVNQKGGSFSSLHVLSCYPWSLPGIHPTVDNWIIHGVTHRQPVNAQVYLLDVVGGCYLRIIRCKEEVDVLRGPADGKNNNYDHHHKHNLEIWEGKVVSQHGLIWYAGRLAPEARLSKFSFITLRQLNSTRRARAQKKKPIKNFIIADSTWT